MVQPNKSKPNLHLYSQAQSDRQNNELICCTWNWAENVDIVIITVEWCPSTPDVPPPWPLCGCSCSLRQWHPWPQIQGKESGSLPQASKESSSLGPPRTRRKARLAEVDSDAGLILRAGLWIAQCSDKNAGCPVKSELQINDALLLG